MLPWKKVLSGSKGSASEPCLDVKVVGSGRCSIRSFKQLMVLQYKTRPWCNIVAAQCAEPSTGLSGLSGRLRILLTEANLKPTCSQLVATVGNRLPRPAQPCQSAPALCFDFRNSPAVPPSCSAELFRRALRDPPYSSVLCNVSIRVCHIRPVPNALSFLTNFT
jgi:hypothetical protein